MTKRQKEILKLNLKREQEVLDALEQAYEDASKTIAENIETLLEAYEQTGLRSKVYQLKYQKAMKKQIDGVLNALRRGEYKTIADFLEQAYTDGFLSTIYDMQGQGVPLIFPVDPTAMYKAVTLESKLSHSLYKQLGINVNTLKKNVKNLVTRGIASGWSYEDIATALNYRMRIGKFRSLRIARTEGQRVLSTATFDAMKKAKEEGADIVKEWNGILDNRIRSDHRQLHGQIKELDEYFEVNGYKAQAPCMFGVAKEDINCRCTLLQRARWALEDEGDGFIEADDLDDFLFKAKEITK